MSDDRWYLLAIVAVYALVFPQGLAADVTAPALGRDYVPQCTPALAGRAWSCGNGLWYVEGR